MQTAFIDRFTSPIAARADFIGIFIVALAVLAYQVLLTRLFSVVIYYHFAFAGISLVMLGLTIGTLRVYLNPIRYSSLRLREEWALSAVNFSVSSILCVLWFVYSPLIIPERATWLVVVVSLLLFAIPFVHAGVCVTLILMRSSIAVSKLYAADLIGAACGCIGIVAILFVLDPISIFVGLAALIGMAACILAPTGTAISSRARLLTGALSIACLVQSTLYLSGHDHLRLIWAKDMRQEQSLFERWNPISRIRVVPFGGNALAGVAGKPFGWGFGHPHSEYIDQYYLDIDAGASTAVTRFDGGDLSRLAFLGNDVINMAYHIRTPKTVAIVGVGGGRDVLSALYFGAKRVTGIELNPTIFEVLTDRFGDFAGHLDRRPDVMLVNAEARSWLNASKDRFDLLQISLIDTWAATAAGGLTMSENRLYTLDAWQEFMARLQPDGMLSVSRWFDQDVYKGELYRLLSLAAETMKARGIPPDSVKMHVMAFTVNKIITVVVSPTPFSEAEISQARRTAEAEGFSVVIDPGAPWDEVSQTILSGRANQEFYDGLPVDISAPTDNRPFFFYTIKPFRLLFGKDAQNINIITENDITVQIIGLLLLGTFAAVCLFILAPLYRVSRSVSLGPLIPHLGFFMGIGLGFMLIEISQMQRLMVFLGNPVYGLTVVLFTLLLFGGIGSTTVAASRSTRIWYRPALCCAVLCVVGLLTPLVTSGLKEFGVVARVLASVALLAPAGFYMGMMFPTGMVLSMRFRAQQAWFWGINGATSVFASVLGMFVSMEFGITQAYWCGVVCYALCLLFTLRQGGQQGVTQVVDSATEFRALVSPETVAR